MNKGKEPDQERISKILGSKMAPCGRKTFGLFGAMMAFAERGLAAQEAVDDILEKDARERKAMNKKCESCGSPVVTALQPSGFVEHHREGGLDCVRTQLAQVRKDARETICGARRILADDALSDEAKVENLKNHFTTARALLLVWEPASPAICKALDAAVEAHREPEEGAEE